MKRIPLILITFFLLVPKIAGAMSVDPNISTIDLGLMCNWDMWYILVFWAIGLLFPITFIIFIRIIIKYFILRSKLLKTTQATELHNELSNKVRKTKKILIILIIIIFVLIIIYFFTVIYENNLYDSLRAEGCSNI